MADTLRIEGSVTVAPSFGAPSGVPSIRVPLSEVAQVGVTTPTRYTLDSDDPLDVSLGGADEVNVVSVKVISGGSVRLRFTSAHGSQQAIPCDDYHLLKTRTHPITAIDMTREAGVQTVVEVLTAKYA